VITSAGPRCDVCDGYILTDKSINPFFVKGIKETLHCHDECKQLVIDASGWESLPEGRLKRAFAANEKPQSEDKEIIE